MKNKNKSFRRKPLCEIILMFVVSIFAISILMSFLLISASFFTLISFSKTNIESKPEITLSKVEKIKASGKLVVGTCVEYPPYEFHLLNDNELDIVGIDIDVARIIASDLGVKLELKKNSIQNLFKALNSDQVDIVIAGLCPSEKRKKLVDFSEIYFQAIQDLLIRAENAETIRSIEDLRGKKVGIQKGTILEDIAQEKICGVTFFRRETINELVTDLKSNRIDAVTLEKAVAESYAFRNRDLINIECHKDAFGRPLGSAIAVKKGDKDLLDEINKIIRKLKHENKIYEYLEDAKILLNK